MGIFYARIGCQATENQGFRTAWGGKEKNPTEFGAKYDVSIDEKGHARLEKIQFDPYNEGTVFQGAVEAYYQCNGHYPARALVDQIYRTRKNRDYCKEHGIRMSGPKLDRPSRKASTEEEYQDNTDRIEVERFFNLDKRCSGAGLIMTRLSDTALSSIALSVFVTNLFAIPADNIFCFILRKAKTAQIPAISSNSKQRNLSLREFAVVCGF